MMPTMLRMPSGLILELGWEETKNVTRRSLRKNVEGIELVYIEIAINAINGLNL